MLCWVYAICNACVWAEGYGVEEEQEYGNACLPQAQPLFSTSALYTIGKEEKVRATFWERELKLGLTKLHKNCPRFTFRATFLRLLFGVSTHQKDEAATFPVATFDKISRPEAGRWERAGLHIPG